MLTAETAVLVVIDVQGKLATLMHEREALFDNVGRMIRGARVLGIPVIWNEQLPDKLGPTIPRIKELLTGVEPLVKKTFSCCGNDGFVRRLAGLGRGQVLVVGMETHVCVYQTARDLLHSGYEVYLVADAVSSRTLENKRLAIEALTGAGARVTSVEMALFEMVVVAEGDQFRQISHIVK